MKETCCVVCGKTFPRRSLRRRYCGPKCLTRFKTLTLIATRNGYRCHDFGPKPVRAAGWEERLARLAELASAGLPLFRGGVPC